MSNPNEPGLRVAARGADFRSGAQTGSGRRAAPHREEGPERFLRAARVAAGSPGGRDQYSQLDRQLARCARMRDPGPGPGDRAHAAYFRLDTDESAYALALSHCDEARSHHVGEPAFAADS